MCEKKRILTILNLQAYLNKAVKYKVLNALSKKK